MKWLTVAIAVISLSWIAFGVVAQSSRQPEGLVPLPEYTEPIAQDGMPGPDSGLDPSLEPEVTITEGKDETVEEYRVNGQLYMIKITPKLVSLIFCSTGTGQANPLTVAIWNPESVCLCGKFIASDAVVLPLVSGVFDRTAWSVRNCNQR